MANGIVKPYPPPGGIYVNYQSPLQGKPTLSDVVRAGGQRIGDKIDNFFCRTLRLGCGPRISSQISPQITTTKGNGAMGNNKMILLALGIGAILLLK